MKYEDYELGSLDNFIDNYSKADKKDFYNAYVTVNNVIFRWNKEKGHVETLTVKKPNQPFKDFYSLVGGFLLDNNETTDEAIERITKEKIGLDISEYYHKQIKTYTDPRRDIRGRVISIAYITILPEGTDVSGDVNWCPIGYSSIADRYEIFLKGTMYNVVMAKQYIKNIYDRLESYYNNVYPYRYEINEKNSLAFDHIVMISDALSYIKGVSQDDYPLPLLMLKQPFTALDARAILRQGNFSKASYYNSTGNFIKHFDDYIEKVGKLDKKVAHVRSGQFLYKLK